MPGEAPQSKDEEIRRLKAYIARLEARGPSIEGTDGPPESPGWFQRLFLRLRYRSQWPAQ